VFIFGYGSLVSVIGINGRNLSKKYVESDLQEVRLNEYKRSWNAVGNFGEGSMRFLGLTEDSRSYVNGVIFELNYKDVETFLTSEGSHPSEQFPVYRFVDVTDKVYPKQIHQVFTCVTSRPQKGIEIPTYYLQIISKCLTIRGKEFESDFWKTTEDEESLIDFKNYRIEFHT